MAADKRHGSTEQADEGQRVRPRASEKSEPHRFAQNVPDRDGTVAERDDEDPVLAERDSAGEEPDVLLDVPVVKVDEINLDVEQLRARISLQAEVLDLLRLNVGADVFIGQVGLEIKGVEAQALLKVRLDNVARILDRVLATIDRNPEILEQITSGVRSAVEDVGGVAGTAVGELGQGAAAAVEEVGEGAGSAVEDTGETVRRTAQGAGKTVRRVAGRGGKTAKDAEGAAQREPKRRTAKRPGATRGRRRVKRSNE
jgi:hypothetical protein